MCIYPKCTQIAPIMQNVIHNGSQFVGFLRKIANNIRLFSIEFLITIAVIVLKNYRNAWLHNKDTTYILGCVFARYFKKL